MRFEKLEKWALGAAIALLAVSTFSLFTSPARAQTRVYPTDLTNIAAAANGGRIISASSTIDNDARFSANNLIDGQIFDPARNEGSAGWASNKFDPVNMDYVTIGFADNALRKIGKIALNPTSAVAPERWAKDVEVQVSTETAEGPYRAIQQLTLRRAAERQEFTILPANARFVRFLFRTNWGSDRAVSLGEIEIYEAIGQDDPLGQLIARLEGAINDLQRYRQTQIDLGGATRTVSTPEESTFGLDAATLQLVQATTGGAVTGGAQLPVSSVNIAAAKNGGQIVDYSSVFTSNPAQGADPNYGPEKLIDGQNFSLADDKGSFGWASQGFAPGKQFVTIGFRDDRTRLVSKFVLNPVSNQSPLRWARRVDVQVTTGAAKTGPFRTVTTLNLRPEAVNQEFTIRPVEAKYVRFLFMANGPGNVQMANADPDVNSDRAVSLGEIEIYEATASGDVLDALIGRLNQVLIDLKRLRSENKLNLAANNAQNATLFAPEPKSGADRS